MKLKPLRSLSVLTVVVGLPLIAFAQSSNGPLTREQVLHDLLDLEGVGYRPAQSSSLRFPYDIEAAEQRVVAKKRSLSSQRGAGSESQSGSRSGDPTTTGSTAQP